MTPGPVAPVSKALRQFVEDEMLRAPLLFDQVIDGALEHAQASLGAMSSIQRSAVADLLHALKVQRPRLAEYYLRSLSEQVQSELARPGRPPHPPLAPADDAKPMALVDEDVVAIDVELSHTIEAIRSIAEYELRELQTFISALVGDMDVACDHNPFRAETHANALWASAQGLGLSRGHQLAYMRHAGASMALQLRKSYAASCSRLESMGIEPAAYRTLILPAGSRRGTRPGETTFSPDLYRMRDSMPTRVDTTLTFTGHLGADAPPPRESWREIARTTANRVDRQSIELVNRLFESMLADKRVPADVSQLISRLHGPAMRLTLRDGDLLDQEKHPLWRFINRLAYEAEMAPDPNDPERAQLLATAHGIIEQVSAETEQNAGLYRWSIDRLESFLHTRMTRRLAASATQIGALQKLEDRLGAQNPPSTFHGMLDVPQLDTVPAELLADGNLPAAAPGDGAEAWLDALRPGDWVRMFLQGRWVHARLLWPGERREVWLFGDGASDATWAVRRGALLMMFNERLAKTLRQRSIVASAANRVQDRIANA